MLRYTTDRARPGLVAFYDIRPGNGAGQFLQPRSPHGAVTYLSRGVLQSSRWPATQRCQTRWWIQLLEVTFRDCGSTSSEFRRTWTRQLNFLSRTSSQRDLQTSQWMCYLHLSDCTTTSKKGIKNVKHRLVSWGFKDTFRINVCVILWEIIVYWNCLFKVGTWIHVVLTGDTIYDVLTTSVNQDGQAFTSAWWRQCSETVRPR